MKNIKYIFVAAGLILGLFSIPAFAEGTTTNTTTTAAQLQQLIQTLQQQIASLQAQMQALNQALEQVKITTKDISTSFRIINQLKLGMTGDDVKLLQEILSTDPDIYPEGLITGRYGKLTEKAVRRFQEKACLGQVGNVGPKTLEKLNELLDESEHRDNQQGDNQDGKEKNTPGSKINDLLEYGAGKSGKVPPGLLRASGILKKLCGTSTAPTTTPDTVPPVISGTTATGTASTSIRIAWTTNEKANSKVWYGTTDPLIISTTTASVSNSEFSLSHSLKISGLTASTTYYYVASSVDKAGNKTLDSQKSFTTLSF